MNGTWYVVISLLVSLKDTLLYLTDHRFLVDIAKAPLTLKHSTLALLFVHGPMLCLTTRSSQSAGPPSILASWTVFDLRRFGVLESKFCFQVNNADGKCQLLLCAHKQINIYFLFFVWYLNISIIYCKTMTAFVTLSSVFCLSMSALNTAALKWFTTNELCE